MNRKMTKNDSMNTIFGKATELVDKFEQLLRSYNVYYIYYATFYEQNIDELSSNLYDDWRNWADSINPKYWICFIKDCDPNPNRLIDWHKINCDWVKCCDENIKK